MTGFGPTLLLFLAQAFGELRILRLSYDATDLFLDNQEPGMEGVDGFHGFSVPCRPIELPEVRQGVQ